MTERRPIYSAQAAGQQIGYVEDDEAFDLFDRPCAIYDSNTSLLRDPKDNAVVGYVSLADIFVGPSWMAQELFSKTGPVAPQAGQEELGNGHADAPACGAEDGNAENVDAVRLIAQAQSHHAANLSVTSTPVHSEKAGVQEPAPHATDITTPEADASLIMPEPSDESAFESAQPDDPSGRDSMPSGRGVHATSQRVSPFEQP